MNLSPYIHPLEWYYEKTVILRHKTTNEEHGGLVIDYCDIDLIIEMDDSARFLLDEGEDMTVDLRHSKLWELLETH